MLFSARCGMTQDKRFVKDGRYGGKLVRLLGVCLLLITVGLEFLSTTNVQASVESHTNVSTVNMSCSQVTFSSDGNPFPLCPGTYPQGGNCTWWSWEQWHLLGYNLPNNWGNAADWIVDATRAGLPIGTTPRVGSIAVFPRSDGLWAANAAGHVAFVVDVSSNNETFSVTYQNYGDPTFMYVGKNYNTSLINQPQYQNGALRFIYFPRPIDVQLFAKLPGISATNPVAAVNQANKSLTQGDSTNSTNQTNTVNSNTNNNSTNNAQGARSNSTTTSYTSDRVALGLTPVSTDQELNADFTGQGTSNLLLYNRQQGNIDIFRFDTNPAPGPQQPKPRFVDPDTTPPQNQSSSLSQRVSLGDSITPAGKWGSALDIHVGDFTGTGADDILLYDRNTGSLQLISLNPDLTIKNHAVLSNIGIGWEIYVGRLDGKRSAIFLYKRFAFSDPNASDSTNSSDQSNSTDTSDQSSPTNPSTFPDGSTNNSTTTSQNNNSSVDQSQPTSTVTATPTATATSQPTGTVTLTPTPTSTVTATPTATTTPKATPTATTTPKATSTSVPTPTASPSPTATPMPTPVPTPVPTATPTAPPAQPKATPTAPPLPQPTATPTTQPSSKPTVTPTPQAQSTAAPKAATLSKTGSLPGAALSEQVTYQDPTPTVTSTKGGSNLGGTTPQDWNKQGRTANILIMDFSQDFSVAHEQWYSLWHANWEVYVGRFVNAQQDGIFLYDRSSGEARLMDFNDQLLVNDYQEMHNLSGNWLLYSGDFANIGRSQMVLYDPSSGNAQMLLFDSHLALKNQQSYSNLGTNQIVYVGRFGMPTVSLMLYDPQNAQSTFIGFDQSLDIVHQYLVNSWNQNQQILVGSFQDRSQCDTINPCSQDNILILNRQNGQIQRYTFSFGRQFQVYDNRIQGLQREGDTTAEQHITSVDSSTFKLITTLNTTIHDEELY